MFPDRKSASNDRKHPITRVRADEIERQVVVPLAAYPALNMNMEQQVDVSSSGPDSASTTRGRSSAARQFLECSVQRITLDDGRVEIALTNQGARMTGRDAISLHWKPTPQRVARQMFATSTTDDELTRLDIKTRASLLRAIARSRSWLNDIVSDGLDVQAIAAREARTVRSINLMLPLAFMRR
jgi:hypothetical protein